MNTAHRILIASIAIGLMTLGASCSKTATTTTNSTTTVNTTTNTVTNGAQVSVTIQNMMFAPSTLNVRVGDTVVWTNNDSVAHTVTGDTAGPRSTSIAQGGTYSYTFTTSGTFSYHCSIHPSMMGTVMVAE